MVLLTSIIAALMDLEMMVASNLGTAKRDKNNDRVLILTKNEIPTV